MPKQTRQMTTEPAASEMQRQAGARIRAIRELANASQESISEVIGVDQSTWSKWERGDRMPEVYAMTKFAARSRATLDLIYCGRPEASHPTLIRLLRVKVPHLLVAAPTNTDQDMDTALASYRAAIEIDRP